MDVLSEKQLLPTRLQNVQIRESLYWDQIIVVRRSCLDVWINLFPGMSQTSEIFRIVIEQKAHEVAATLGSLDELGTQHAEKYKIYAQATQVFISYHSDLQMSNTNIYWWDLSTNEIAAFKSTEW